jgi:hypothetical protein
LVKETNERKTEVYEALRRKIKIRNQFLSAKSLEKKSIKDGKQEARM